MTFKTRRVLLLYTDRYYFIKQIYPYGLDIMANYLRQYGHDVFIESPFLSGDRLEENVKDILEIGVEKVTKISQII